MTKIAVYGSLRKNHGNWRWLLNCDPIKTEVVNIPFRMISLGGFPGLIPSAENHDITIEIYDVNNRTYQGIESLEGYPSFYQKAIIPSSEGDLEVYVLLSKRYQRGYDYVENGDWNSHYSPRYEKVIQATD